MEVGANLLGEYLYPLGFHFEIISEGAGSGGAFVGGVFKRDTLKLEIHFRDSLGMVSYHLNENSVSHENYMSALGVRERCQYPGFSAEPLDAFRHLKHDLLKFGDDFTGRDNFVLKKAIEAEKARVAHESKKLEAKYLGDDKKITKGKQYFKLKKYKECIEILESIQFPEFLSNSDRKILELAQKRLKDT